MTAITEVTTGLQFPEGPIAMPDGSVILVEIARGTLTRVAEDGGQQIIAELGGGPNGAAIGPDGKCYVCNNGGFRWHIRDGRYFPGYQADDYAGGWIEQVDLASGEVKVLYRACDGERLKGPNDIVFDKSGGFWFTDHGKLRKRSRDRTGVYYATPDGKHIREAIFPVDGPNGIGLSPDEQTLYVAETHAGRLWAYDLKGPGEIVKGRGPVPWEHGRLLAGMPDYRLFDSLAVDGGGHVCVATIGNGGITVVAPDGSGWEHVPTPDPITTNICFGGPELETAYITLSSTGKLISMPWWRPGLPLNFLNK